MHFFWPHKGSLEAIPGGRMTKMVETKQKFPQRLYMGGNALYIVKGSEVTKEPLKNAVKEKMIKSIKK